MKNAISEILYLMYSKDISLMDAIILFAEENQIQVEEIAIAISRNEELKSMLEREAKELRMLKDDDK